MSDKINKVQIGFADDFSYGDDSIKYVIGQDNALYLYVEDCARALGVTQTKTLKEGGVSETVRWERVYDDLVGIERISKCGDLDFKDLSKEQKAEVRIEMKEMLITESQLYLWSFRVGSDQGKKFRDWLATIVLPNLREHGIYVTGMENMTPDQIQRVTDERVERYILRKFGIGIRRELTDTIKKVLNPLPFEGYKYAMYTNIVYRVLFGMDCQPYKTLLGLTKKDNLRDCISDKDINKISKAEDFMGNLIMSGITDVTMLENLMSNWNSNVS